MTDITLTQVEYEGLVTLARRGLSPNEMRTFETRMLEIERRNGIEVRFLGVRWTETGAPNPPHYTFPRQWPPTQSLQMRKVGPPITREEVEAEVEHRGKRPVDILVSPDPGMELGWTTLDDYFRMGT